MSTAPLFFPLPRAAPRFLVAHGDEAALIQAARRGEIAALDALLNAHRERILNLAFQILRDRDAAEDAAQEAFVRAFSRLGEFRGQARFATWIYRIALNLCLEKRRAQKVESPIEAVSTPGFDARIEGQMALEDALQRLPEPLRVALILREWHEMTYDEMALVLGVPLGTVRSRLHHARAEFRRIWTQMEAE